MTRSLCALLALVATFAQAAPPPPQVAISPSRFELRIGSKPTVETLRFFNYSEDEVRVKVSLANWDLDDAGAVRLLPPTEQSLDQWMVVNPLEFTVKGGQSQAIRFSIRPRVQPEDGEHRAMIYLDQVPTAKDIELASMRFRFGVAVYADAGVVSRAAQLHEAEVVEANGMRLAVFDIENQGNAHARFSGQYQIWPADRHPGLDKTVIFPDLAQPGFELPAAIQAAGHLPGKPVLPGSRRSVAMQLPSDLPPGDWILDVAGDLSGSPVEHAVAFSVAPPAEKRADASTP